MYIMEEGGGDSVKIQHGWKYTPLYKKGIKKDKNKSMETTNSKATLINFT